MSAAFIGLRASRTVGGWVAWGDAGGGSAGIAARLGVRPPSRDPVEASPERPDRSRPCSGILGLFRANEATRREDFDVPFNGEGSRYWVELVDQLTADWESLRMNHG